MQCEFSGDGVGTAVRKAIACAGASTHSVRVWYVQCYLWAGSAGTAVCTCARGDGIVPLPQFSVREAHRTRRSLGRVAECKATSHVCALSNLRVTREPTTEVNSS